LYINIFRILIYAVYLNIPYIPHNGERVHSNYLLNNTYILKKTIYLSFFTKHRRLQYSISFSYNSFLLTPLLSISRQITRLPGYWGIKLGSTIVGWPFAWWIGNVEMANGDKTVGVAEPFMTPFPGVNNIYGKNWKESNFTNYVIIRKWGFWMMFHLQTVRWTNFLFYALRNV